MPPLCRLQSAVQATVVQFEESVLREHQQQLAAQQQAGKEFARQALQQVKVRL